MTATYTKACEVDFETLVVRACQDIGTALLGGLIHKNPTVRKCTQTTIEHTVPNADWMLTEQGDNTPGRRLAILGG